MNEESFPIYPSSKEAQEFESRKVKHSKYPWSALEIGQSFVIPTGTVKLITVQALASRTGKRMKRKFCVIDHGVEGIEVARIEFKGNDIEFLKTSIDRGMIK